MPVYFQRLENALKRANEFIDVGKKTRALEILCDVLRSRKHRAWKKEHEDIMMKYLELCVELRMSFVAKEGIYQYKIICQQAYIKSFEDTVRKYLQMAEAEAEAAREKSHSTGVDDVDDLDDLQTPESLLMGTVSSEDSQDRTDRVILLPWVRFLWESYRHCLDILRNNPRTERLYHDIAHKAFQFCIKFNRKAEFRKLSENLHLHLDLLKKQQQMININQVSHQQQNFINLNNPDSQAMHLETRLVQLDSAIQMELWQEAYRATDDIKKFGLMNLSKKLPKPQLMANYYQKLALVFWKANCPLFHAAALFKLFTLTKELRKNITPEDVQKMASRVVCATLSIPIPPTRPEIDKLVDTEENVIENHQRNLASLLGLTSAPTRSSLIKDLKRMGVLQHAFPTLQSLYQWLEVEFHPLLLSKRVEECIKFIESCEISGDLSQYTTALKDVTIIRLLKEISQVYESIEYSRLIELCPAIDKIHLEHMIVSAARRNDLQVRIDHRGECFYFGTELRASHGEEIIEGPHLQSMPSEQLRQQLVTMYSVLQKARAMMEPDKLKQQKTEVKRRMMATYEANKKADHKAILERHDYIERRKVELEQIGIEREKKEKELLEEKQRELRLAEEERLAKEAEERQRQMKLKEDLELKKRMALDQLERMKTTDPKLLEGLNEDELGKLKIEDIKSRQMKQLEKERIDQITRQRNYERKIDHFERAKRQEEIPLLLQAYDEWRKRDEEEWIEMENERIAALHAERGQAIQHKERLNRMQDDRDAFVNQVRDRRHKSYVEQYSEWKKQFDEAKVVKLAERKEKRKVERRETYYREKKEAEEKRKAEIERKRKEEERKKKEEEDKEKNKRLEEIAKKQQAKEKEIEERMARERAQERELAREKDAPRKEEKVIERKPPPPSEGDSVDNWRGGSDSREPSRFSHPSESKERTRYVGRSSKDSYAPRDSGRDRDRDRDRERDRGTEQEDLGGWRRARNDDSSKGFDKRRQFEDRPRPSPLYSRRQEQEKEPDDAGDSRSKSYKSARPTWRQDRDEGDRDKERPRINLKSDKPSPRPAPKK